MAQGVIPGLEVILQTLPKDSPEALMLRGLIVAYADAQEVSTKQWSKLMEELATERKKREDAEQKLAQCMQELEKLRSKP